MPQLMARLTAGGTRIIGLTGSIGMGKTTAANMLRRMGVPVFSADACVHDLLAPGGAAVAAVAQAFPGVGEDTSGQASVSRAALGRKVFDDPPALHRLEAILHPLVRAAEISFIADQNRARVPVAALEIPLLFETNADVLCDAVVVLAAPPFVQKSRVLARPRMTGDRLAAIRARQMGEREKCARADFVISTGLGLRRTFIGLKAVVRQLG